MGLPVLEVWADMANWTRPLHGRGRVDAAGATLISSNLVMARDMDDALNIVNNWRTSHTYPLKAFTNTLVNRAWTIDKRAVVAQRRKRLPSIIVKLRRFRDMKLSQMNDIGGCRAIVSSVRRVYALTDLYDQATAKKPNAGPIFHRKYDYIADPKDDGYRSIHLVYKYRSGADELQCFNGHRVEIQLRTKLQHAWATALETVDAFTGQALKSNFGRPEWARFFALAASALAHRERQPLVPGTPTNKAELIEELREVERTLSAWEVLHGLMVSTEIFGVRPEDAATILLELDVDSRLIKATAYAEDQLPKASDDYLMAEKRNTGSRSRHAVLVAVDEVDHLRKAFPNYYADTHVFLDALVHATGIKPKGTMY